MTTKTPTTMAQFEALPDAGFRKRTTTTTDLYWILNPEPVLSNYKLNRFNWMHESYVGNGASKFKKACRIGLFSKIVTLRICKILYRLRSSWSCFFKMATST